MSLTHALQDEACLSLSVSIAVSDGHADMVKFQFVVKCFLLTQNLLEFLLQWNVFGDSG